MLDQKAIVIKVVIGKAGVILALKITLETNILAVRGQVEIVIKVVIG